MTESTAKELRNDLFAWAKHNDYGIDGLFTKYFDIYMGGKDFNCRHMDGVKFDVSKYVEYYDEFEYKPVIVFAVDARAREVFRNQYGDYAESEHEELEKIMEKYGLFLENIDGIHYGAWENE